MLHRASALLLATLLLGSLPAQEIVPTNIVLHGVPIRYDVLQSGGKVYLLVAWAGSPMWQMLDPKYAALPVRIGAVGLYAFDSRPCARIPTSPSTLQFMGIGSPAYWVINPTSGDLFWFDPSRTLWTYGEPWDPYYDITYNSYTGPRTPCVPYGHPDVAAVLFEVDFRP